MSEQEKQIRELEESFPSLSGAAFAAAYKQTLASGQSVLISEEGVIYEIFPDGSRKRIKEIPPPTPVTAGDTVIVP